MSETPKLGKDEPHPVGPLRSSGEFLNYPAIDRGLSSREAKEIRLGHRCSNSLGLMRLCYVWAAPAAQERI